MQNKSPPRPRQKKENFKNKKRKRKRKERIEKKIKISKTRVELFGLVNFFFFLSFGEEKGGGAVYV